MNGSDLAVYAVWVPILGSDTEAKVEQAVGRLPDPRVRHYWDGAGTLVKAYSWVLSLGEQPAWDVYFAYGRGVEWKGDPPVPTSWMHQLRLAPERRLDGTRLAGEITSLLAAPGVGRSAAPKPLEIVVYRAGECGSWREAVATTKEAVRELGLKAKLRVVIVRDIEEAKRLKFHGSPSVVVNGVDVEGPGVEQRPASFG